MNKTTKVLLAGIGSICGAVAAGFGFHTWSKVRYGRSGTATIVEGALRAMSARKNLLGDDLGRFEDYIIKRKEENEKDYSIPSWIKFKSLVFEETHAGMKTFHLGTTGMNNHAVLYIHGGAYVQQILPWHWFFLDSLCQLTGAEILVPLYPLAPAHDYEEAYTLLTDLYKEACKRYGADSITLMGDSAGGGLAAGLAEAFTLDGIEQPAHLVLLSPELDLTQRNPAIADYFDVDPLLSPWGLAQAGDLWADGDDPTGFRLSPINGNVSALRDVTIYAGTREIFYPDIVRFNAMLEQAGVEHTLVVGHGLNHAWPLFPIPEAQTAVQNIARIVKQPPVHS